MKKHNNIIDNREMNFELLRIVSMILIILAHYAGHGGVGEVNIVNSNRIIGSFLEIGGKFGTNLFLLITGYFFMKSEFSYKKFFKLLFQVWVFSIVIGILLPSIYYGNLISLKLIIKSVLPISFKIYWFPTVYLGFYLLSPFIKKFVISLDKKMFDKLIIILSIMLVIIPTFIPGSHPFTSDMMVALFMIFLGIYINIFLSKPENQNFKIKSVICSIIMILIIFVSQVISIILSQKYDIFSFGVSFLRNHNSLPMVILSLSTFKIFRNIKIPNNKLISVLGKTSFGVYLFHDNPNFKTIMWKDILKTDMFYYCNVLLLCVHILFCIIVIYTIGTIIDLLRVKFIEKPVFKSKKIENILKKLDQY